MDDYRLVLPLVIRELTSIFLGKFGTVNADDSLAFSMFGFLYGMIPSAPAVFVYASAYNLEMDLVCIIIFCIGYIDNLLIILYSRLLVQWCCAYSSQLQ